MTPDCLDRAGRVTFTEVRRPAIRRKQRVAGHACREAIAFVALVARLVAVHGVIVCDDRCQMTPR